MRLLLRGLTALTVLILVALVASKQTAPPAPAQDKKENKEFRESPPQFWVEDIPATPDLPASTIRAKSVPAIGTETPQVGPAWTFLGPAPIPNGQTQNRVDPVSGRVTAIAIHPNNPDIVYVGTFGVVRTSAGFPHLRLESSSASQGGQDAANTS